MKINCRILSAVFIAFMLTGCGFHLRGVVDLPKWLDNVFIISSDQQRDLSSMLKNQLEAYKIHISADPDTADYWLYIEDDIFHQQIASVSSSTTPRQYQMVYNVRFRLVETKGREIIPSRQVSVTRQVTINNDRILGSNDEESITKNEMRRDAASLIITMISKERNYVISGRI